jgi:hypothetical protein
VSNLAGRNFFLEEVSSEVVNGKRRASIKQGEGDPDRSNNFPLSKGTTWQEGAEVESSELLRSSLGGLFSAAQPLE